MAWIADFLYSSISDTLLPVVRPLLEDVVYDILNDRQIPTRTDYREMRDLVNDMRGAVSTATNLTKRLDKRIEALETAQNEQALLIEALKTQVATPKTRPPSRRKAASPKKKKTPAKKAKKKAD